VLTKRYLLSSHLPVVPESILKRAYLKETLIFGLVYPRDGTKINAFLAGTLSNLFFDLKISLAV
jgi:hypothetical protein